MDRLARVMLNAIRGWHAYLEIDFHSRPSAINLRNLESHATQLMNALMKLFVGIPAEIVSIRVAKRSACSNTVYPLMLLLVGHQSIMIC